MSINRRNKVLLVKIESTYGQDANPSGAANAVLATDITVTPMEGSDVSRDLELPYFGAQATIPTELHARISFSIELAPSGAAGTPPAWGPILRGCGVAEVIDVGTSVTYNPVTDAHESVTIYLYIGETLYALKGARGTAKFNVTAQAQPKIEFEFTGLFVKPAESARPAADQTAFQKPEVATSARTPVFTIGGTPLIMRTAMLDLANSVEGRFLIGSEKILITDREDLLETTVEAVPLTTIDPFDLAQNQTQVAVQLVHGTVAGKIATLDVPAAQMQRPQGLSYAQNIKEWPLRLIPLPVTGNDQWTLTLT